jgi:hypothetical protein
MLIDLGVVWLTFLLRILEVQGSNLSPKIVYPKFLAGFLSPFRQMTVQYLKISPRPLTSKSCPIYHPLVTLSFDAI